MLNHKFIYESYLLIVILIVHLICIYNIIELYSPNKNNIMVFAYARVSTQKQSIASQLLDLEKYGYDELFSDVISGKEFNRPEYSRMIEKLRRDDIVVIWRLDRLGRSIVEIMKIIEHFKKNDIILVSIMDGIDTRNSTGKLIIGLLATLSEYEYELLNERRLAGINEARRRGVKLGRPVGLSSDAKSNIKIAKKLYHDPNFTVKQIITKLGISKTTFYKYLQIDSEEKKNSLTEL